MNKNNMIYNVSEIFLSFQGEGYWAGTPSIFIRLAGCNLRCSFCDTDFRTKMKVCISEIIDICDAIGGYCKRVVLTGGEPTIQNIAPLIRSLHRRGFFVAIETNGTNLLPCKLDWVTLSPKRGKKIVLTKCDELKVVYIPHMRNDFENIQATYKFLQPCEVNGIRSDETKRNIIQTLGALKWDPEFTGWRLSLQIHKMIGER